MEKIRDQKKIRIIGDYDIDGVSAVCILLEGLQRLGAQVDICIPDRIADGYGIHDHLIDRAVDEQVDTILTCDNGIAAADQIRRAKEMGLTVVVTDHHEVPFEEAEGKKTYILPPADVVIDPKQPGEIYPDQNICGAVVAWKLVLSLYDRSGLDAEEGMEFLDLAAVATVGDVMDLTGENRIIVKEGLKTLPGTKREGLRQLIRAVGLEDRPITTYHVGFVIGPCINAGGRLDTALRALDLLLEKDPEKASVLAGDLCALNESRKELTEKGKEQALLAVAQEGMLKDTVLVVYLPECHESLAGIIAGRLREVYHRPSFVLTKGETCVKGSGRSVDAYSMYDELVRCQDLLIQFGGHPAAAGLSMEEENIEAFRRRLNENSRLTAADLTEKIQIDAAMPIAYISKRLVGQMELLEPFGKGNTRPLFAQKELRAVDCRVLGKNRNVLRMRLEDPNGASLAAVYFGNAERLYEELHHTNRIAVTYYPEINRYQGRESLQLVIQNYKVY